MKKRQRQEHEQKNGSVALSSTVDVSSGNLSSSNANGKQHRPVTNEDWAGGSLTASGCGPANLCREGNKEICTGGAKRWLLPTTLLPASCWRPLSVKPFGWSALGAVLAVLVLLTLPNTAEAGKCVDTPKGSTAFCQISYQVYVSADTMANDTAYWSVSFAFVLMILLFSAPIATVPCPAAQRSNPCKSARDIVVVANVLLYTHRFDLDKKAETLTEEWNKNMGCSQRFDCACPHARAYIHARMLPAPFPTACAGNANRLHI